MGLKVVEDWRKRFEKEVGNSLFEWEVYVMDQMNLLRMGQKKKEE